MHRVFVLLLVLLHHEIISAAATSGACQRRCGGVTFPYPLGFSAGCPIALSCDSNASVSLLPYRGGDNGTSHHVISFNSTASTVVVALPPLCSRSVPDAKRALSGANYGVSSRTGLFLRGGCVSNVSVCSVPAGVMTNLLRTAQCGDNGTASGAGDVWCVASAAPNATSLGIFLNWDKAEITKCDDVLTSAVFGDTASEGTVSLEFGLAELGWWLNGTCAGGGGDACVANATCSDVRTPTGAAGYRCSCLAGMDGDGFVAGDGCYLAMPGSKKKPLLL